MRILFFLSLFGQAFGFTVAFSNVPSADSSAVPILDGNGDPITRGSGFVAAGTYSESGGEASEGLPGHLGDGSR